MNKYLAKKQLESKERLKRAKRLIDNKTGIIEQIFELTREPDDPKIWNFITQIADTSRYFPHRCASEGAGGGLTKEIGMMATIGEAIERYCCSMYDKREFIFSSYNDLSRKAIKPENIVLFSEKQYAREKFKFSKFTRDSKINWVQGYSLIKKKPILVPACLVYIPYLFEKGEESIGYAVSTGLACGGSIEEAVLTGIYEVIERDAIMIMWLNKLSMPGVTIDSRTWLNEIFEERFMCCGTEFYLVNITTDIGIPTLFCLVVNDNSKKAVASTGAAAHLEPGVATIKALIEASQTRAWAKDMVKRGHDLSYKDDFSNIQQFEHHVQLYGKREMLPHLEFLCKPPITMRINEMANLSTGCISADLKFCLNTFAAKGMDVIAVEVTLPDIANLGFYVVKIFITDMQPLNAPYHYRFLGGKRLYGVPKILGHTNKRTKEEDLNPLPHPFP